MSDTRSGTPQLTASGIALVSVGGACGTGARYLLGAAVPAWAGVPVVTLTINVVGAFLLGVLLERLSRPTADARAAARHLRTRLLAGTGVLGGFTTYSALATDTLLLLGAHPGRAAAYAVLTVLGGVVAAALGIWYGHRTPAAVSGLASG